MERPPQMMRWSSNDESQLGNTCDTACLSSFNDSPSGSRSLAANASSEVAKPVSGWNSTQVLGSQILGEGEGRLAPRHIAILPYRQLVVMSCFELSASMLFVCILSLFITTNLHAQTCLTLSSAKVAPGKTASLDLSLISLSGMRPAAVQWTLQYSSVSGITVDDGPVLASAEKTVICAGDAPAYRCLIVGANPNVIANGVVARVTVALTPGTRTATILVSNSLGASSGGEVIPFYSQSGTITVVNGFSQRETNPSPNQSIGRGSFSPQPQEKDR